MTYPSFYHVRTVQDMYIYLQMIISTVGQILSTILSIIGGHTENKIVKLIFDLEEKFTIIW